MPISSSAPESAPKSVGPAQILVVDDDTAILKLIETVLKSKGMAPTVAATVGQAQEALKKNADFSVILCDHLLPDGLGVEFLRDLRTQRPDLVRVLMTGLYDKALAMDAINSGEIYRFLVKPFTVEDLLATISQSLDRHRLSSENSRLQAQLALQNEELRKANVNLDQRVTEEENRSYGLFAESSNWRQAFNGMIELSLEILQRIDPQLFKHSQRVSLLAGAIGRELGLDAELLAKLETAAQLHDIGLLGCNAALRAHQRSLDQIASPGEREQIREHPHISAQLVKFLPLSDVVDAIEQHHEYLDGSGYPNALAGERISKLARILSVADAYDEVAANGANALAKITTGVGLLYEPDVVHALGRVVSKGLAVKQERQVLLRELIPGMKLTESIYTATGMLLVKQGQVLSKSMIDRLLQHAESNAITQQILIEA